MSHLLNDFRMRLYNQRDARIAFSVRNPHIWTMNEFDAKLETAAVASGFRAPVISPHCLNCGVTSWRAQIKQPETKGEGPCPGKK